MTTGLTAEPAHSGVWSRRLLTWILALWVVAIPIGWVSWAYLQVPVNEVISAPADDGHCTRGLEGIGVHCFGDYFYPAKLAASQPTWVYPSLYPHSYTASGMVPHVLANTAGNLFGSVQAGLALFLVALVIALLVPAVLLAVRLRPPVGVLALIVLGVGSLPFLLAVDRGNSVALVAPLVLWLAWATVTKRWSQVMAAIVLASLLRPQFILLALILLSVRQWRYLIATGVLATVFNAAAFALWPRGFTANFVPWLQSIGSYSGMVPLERNNPTNLSTAHAITVLTRAGRVFPDPIRGWLESLQQLITAMPWLPGLVLLIVVTVVLFLRGRVMADSSMLIVVTLLPVLVPSLSFGYYLVVVLPIAAALLVAPQLWFSRGPAALWGLLDAEETPSRGLRSMPTWLVVAAVSLSIVPLPLAVAAGENSVIAQNLGLLWTVVVVVLLLPIGPRRADAPA